jgi:hypothetical protein
MLPRSALCCQDPRPAWHARRRRRSNSERVRGPKAGKLHLIGRPSFTLWSTYCFHASLMASGVRAIVNHRRMRTFPISSNATSASDAAVGQLSASNRIKASFASRAQFRIAASVPAVPSMVLGRAAWPCPDFYHSPYSCSNLDRSLRGNTHRRRVRF